MSHPNGLSLDDYERLARFLRRVVPLGRVDERELSHLIDTVDRVLAEPVPPPLFAPKR